MEAALEGMIVGGWVQGDRAKLLLRVEALERELSLMEAGRQLERESFASQKESLSRRIVEAGEEHNNVVKELSLRVKGEENLRKVCQRRLQELEAQALLLGEQLGAAEAKFRETGKALRRERTSNTRGRRECLNPCKGRPEGSESMSNSAHDFFESSRDRNVPVDQAPPSPVLGLARHANDCRRRGGVGTEKGDGGARVRTVEAGELRVVERLVEGLLGENLRLGSTLKQLQEGSGISSPADSSAASFLLSMGAVGSERRSEKRGDRGTEEAPEAEKARAQPLAASKPPPPPPPPPAGVLKASADKSDVPTVQELDTIPPGLDRDPKLLVVDCSGQEGRQDDERGRGEKDRRQLSYQDGATASIHNVTSALVRQPANLGQNARPKGVVLRPPRGGAVAHDGRAEVEVLRSDGGRGDHSAEIPKGPVVNEEKTEIAACLSKMHALTGMVRVQEEIEALLAQELRELKKEAKDRERLWRLVIRWEKVLDAKGYSAEHDIRAAGLLTQLRQRVAAEVRSPKRYYCLRS